MHTRFRLTKPHIGWMLFENVAQTVFNLANFNLANFNLANLNLANCILGAWSFFLAQTASLEAWPLGTI